MPDTTIPNNLATVAAGRDLINTKEFSCAVGKSAARIRNLHWRDGSAFGIRPVKIGRTLLWPVVEVAKVLTGGAK